MGKKEKNAAISTIFGGTLSNRYSIWVFPVKSSMNTFNKPENSCRVSQYSNPL